MTTSTPLARSGPDDGEVLDRDEPDPRPDGGDPERGTVLVGVDGSDCALAAVRWAAEEATRRDGRLRLVHAAPYLGRAPLDAAAPHPELPRARRITAQAYTAARHSGPAVPADTEVVAGDPAAVLLRAATGSELVVLGISTTGAPDELVLAPVAQRVAARSTTPVVVVPRPHGRPTARPVVAVLGFGHHADDGPVVEHAAAAARRLGTRLVLLQTGAAARSPAGNLAQEQPGGQADLSGIDVDVRRLPGASPADVVTAACPTPLLVTSSAHGGLHRALDAPHRWLLRHCTSPMALVPPTHRPELEPQEEIIAIG